MCGICGIYNYEQSKRVDEFEIRKMAKTMNHRGPDDEGVYIDGNIGLGHKRLSIIDLTSSAAQPMTVGNGRYTIVFNGEIYNYLELRHDLSLNGYVFKSNSDTEVLLALYIEKGPDCLNFLNGMFSFAIWDSERKVFFAARDRFGIKPFYFINNGKSFAFASEIKALVKTGIIKPEINEEGLNDYLTFQFCIGEKTLFKNVFKLLPGHYILINQGDNMNTKKYWDLDFSIDTDHTESYFKDKLSYFLQDSVNIQLRSDVPVGAHLSGGIDSSSVSSIASSLMNEPLKTFSGGFKENARYDETFYAKLVAEKIGSIYHEIFPSAEDFVKMLPEIIYYLDEPVAGPGVFPQYLVSKLAAEKVKVVLGGQGGDEIFGGYMRYLIVYLEKCIQGGIEDTQRDSDYIVTFDSIFPNLPQLQGYQPLLSYFFKDGLFEPPNKRYFRIIDRRGALKEFINKDLFNKEGEYDVFKSYNDIFEKANTKSIINQMTHFDIKTLLPALLQVEDRTSMAFSLESRVPLLDHRIVELVTSIPPVMKYRGGRSKHFLKEVISDFLPDEILKRKDKMGFPVPLNIWYQKEPVRSFIKDILLGSKTKNRGIFQIEQIDKLLDSELDYGRAIWGLLSIELWMQEFIDG